MALLSPALSRSPIRRWAWLHVDFRQVGVRPEVAAKLMQVKRGWLALRPTGEASHGARLGERLDLLKAQIARHDGDGDGELTRCGAGGERGDQRAGPGRLLRRAQYQNGHVLVVLDLLADGIDQLALADDLLG